MGNHRPATETLKWRFAGVSTMALQVVLLFFRASGSVLHINPRFFFIFFFLGGGGGGPDPLFPPSGSAHDDGLLIKVRIYFL